MFCCCTRDTNSAEESGHKPAPAAPQSSSVPQPQPQGQPNIHSGKGVVSSNQNLKEGASLDKSTVSAATKRDKSPVTEQPAVQAKAPPTASHQSQVNPAPKQSQANPAPKQSQAESSARAKPVELSDVEAQIVEAKASPPSQTLSQITSKAESAAKSVSVISVGKQGTGSVEPPTFDSKVPSLAMPNIEQLSAVHSQLDNLDKAIGQAESKSNWEAKAAVPQLANQLKALTSQVQSAVSGSGAMADKAIQAAVSRLEAVATRLEALAAKSTGAGGSAGGDSDALSPYVLAYDDILAGPLAKFLSLSNDIGGDVKTQSGLVKQAFDAQRGFLVLASKSKQPDQNTFVELLKTSASKLQAVQEFRENNRRSEFFNHLSALSESIAALGWVTVTPAPGPYVKEMADAGTFYTNRVLKDYKEKDPKHVEWSRSWIATLTELQAYIKQFHTTGLSWNPQGVDAKSVQSSVAAAPPPPAAGGPPPPPPPGPPPPPAPEAAGSDDGAVVRSALFAEINKGENVTKGLRKVTDDMKTHKNPLLRLGAAPFKSGPASKPSTVPKPQAAAPARPPLTELQGKKWVIEYHKNNKSIVIDQTELKQSIYAFKCEGSVIQVKGKINSIILDSCKKTAVVFDDLVSSLEFVNCQSMQAQVTGKLPTVSIDKTDGCQIYLSKESLGCEIVTAKSSEMNILVPEGDGDYKEFALPEQFKTVYNGKTMLTTATESV